MYNEKIQEEIDIDASPAKVFEFLADPSNIPLILPGLKENYDIPELPIKEGSKFKYKYELYNSVLEGEITIDKAEAPNEYSFTSSGMGESKWTQKLVDNGGKTHLFLEIEYNTPKTWVEKAGQALAEKTNQGNAEKYLQNLKNALELQS